MNETGERITCFNGEECIYLKCPQFSKQLDTCNFIVIGLLRTSRSGSPPQKTEFIWDINVAAQQVAEKILLEKPNLTAEAIEKMIKEERAKAAGLLTEEAAAYLVASNLGIGQKEIPLFEKGKYVDIKGELIDDPIQKDFDRRDGTVGSRTNFRMDIDGNTYRVTMWGDIGNEAMDYVKGNTMEIEGIRVDEYKGETQFSSSKFTKIVS